MAKTKAQIQASYEKKHVRGVSIKLNRRTDADIIEKIESVPNKQKYIKGLIREDIKKSR